MASPFFKDKKVLVAGGTGLIGANLIARLLAEGAIVRATLHRRPAVIDDPRIEYVRADLTKPEDCQAVVNGMRYIFLCAATIPSAARAVENPMDLFLPNLRINANMLEAAFSAGAEKLVWFSSSTGYPLQDHPVKEEEYFDAQPHDKYYFFGWMNRMSEIFCKMYGEKLSPPFPVIVLRLSSVYGPYDDFEPGSSHVIPALIRKVVERQDPIEVWGSGGDIRDFIYVDDVADAAFMALEQISGYDVFNIGLGKGTSVKELLEEILKLDGYAEVKVIFNPAKPAMIPIRVLDTSKAERILGFRAKTDLPRGLAKTIGWYRRWSGAKTAGA